MSEDEALDRFGEFLMRRVRDQAIADWDMIVAGKMKSERAVAMYQRVSHLPPDAVAVIRTLIPQVVDSTLHQLLWGLEEEESIKIGVEDEEQVHDIRAVSDGLAGELYSEDGWRARFSEQRIE